VIDQELEPSVEVVYLRRLLDIQPGCLLRLGEDGTVLAANDAALMLLGVKSHAEVLGRDLASWFPPDQRDRWRAFTIGVIQGVPASIECDITTPPGDLHPTLFHGVPLADHPDGGVSMAVTARAVSIQRRLEAAVVQHEDRLRELDAARRAAEMKCARALSDVRQLEMALEEFAARRAGGQEPRA
jgi:PAS domain S-box-containing protein